VRLGKLDLVDVLKRLSLLLSNQKVELTAEVERQRIIRAHHLSDDIFKDLHYRISLFALEKINEQLKLLEKESLTTDQCTQQFTRTWGLPCKHTIQDHVRTGRRLTLSDIHSQWHLEQMMAPSTQLQISVDQPASPRKRLLTAIENELYSSHARVGSLLLRFQEVIESPDVAIQEPAVVLKKRGRPAGAKNKPSSLTRDKSQFEYAQGRKCKTCGNSGHNSRTCTNK
jgi:hypothetical protein